MSKDDFWPFSYRITPSASAETINEPEPDSGAEDYDKLISELEALAAVMSKHIGNPNYNNCTQRGAAAIKRLRAYVAIYEDRLRLTREACDELERENERLKSMIPKIWAGPGTESSNG